MAGLELKPYSEQSRAQRIIGRLIAPLLAGVIAGVLLGVSAGAYWAWGILATLGAFLAGSEHRDGWQGADRGLIGGAIYGVALLVTHWVSGNVPRASLGQIPELLILVTAIVGAFAGAAGGALSAAEHRRGLELDPMPPDSDRSP